MEIPGSLEWDELLQEEDLKSILSLPPIMEEVSVSIVWHYEKKVIYSVRSGHRLAVNEFVEDGDNLEQLKWIEIWSMQIPPKVKSFLWRASSKFLPSSETLFERAEGGQCLCTIWRIRRT
ncbi:hypothetical protein DITRI_Ditri04bG0059800 [Diplodiscus trichospermus]